MNRSDRRAQRERPKFCMFIFEETAPPCPNRATETVPGFLPPYEVCREHRELVEMLIDLAT